MSETSKDFSKKLLQRAPSGKLTINGRDEALTNIQAFYDDPENVTLPQHQEDIKERWETIHGLLLKGVNEKRICLKVGALFNVSTSTVRRDMECVELVFGSRKLSFELRRQRASDMSLEVYRMAKKEKNLAAMNAAIANLSKADGLDKEQVDLPFQKLEPHIFIIALPDEIKAQLTQAFPLTDGRIDLNNLVFTHKNTIENAESEDITPQ